MVGVCCMREEYMYSLQKVKLTLHIKSYKIIEGNVIRKNIKPEEQKLC